MRNALFLVIACVLLAGCDYTVPLGTEPGLDLDESVVGLWQEAKEGGHDLLVLPLGKREYLVSYPAGSKDAMFARGCLWRGAGLTLVQLDWFGTAKAGLPEDSRRFQYAAYSLADGMLRVRLLNPEVVKKDLASGSALAAAIEENKGSPELFREAMDFRKAAE